VSGRLVRGGQWPGKAQRETLARVFVVLYWRNLLKTKHFTLLKNSGVGGWLQLAVVHSGICFGERCVWRRWPSFRFLPPLVFQVVEKRLVEWSGVGGGDELGVEHEEGSAFGVQLVRSSEFGMRSEAKRQGAARSGGAA
jgi:hypothetical protein